MIQNNFAQWQDAFEAPSLNAGTEGPFQMYYAKSISAWLSAFTIGFLLFLFAPPVLKKIWFEISMLLLLCFYYLIPPVLITGISDLKKARTERPFGYFWEITGAIGLAFFFAVRLVLKLVLQ